ncbi:hypothetical protein [Actinomadura chokoriensis]|uniref:hypothetical protein n=1 Tax=Actinomadura chokoriensis TaxID=454156 RepID=UPI0031F725E3
MNDPDDYTNPDQQLDIEAIARDAAENLDRIQDTTSHITPDYVLDRLQQILDNEEINSALTDEGDDGADDGLLMMMSAAKMLCEENSLPATKADKDEPCLLASASTADSSQAEALVVAARSKAQAIISEAESKAAQIVADAEERAAETADRFTEVSSALTERTLQFAAEMDRLQHLLESTRARLEDLDAKRADLEAQHIALESWQEAPEAREAKLHALSLFAFQEATWDANERPHDEGSPDQPDQEDAESCVILRRKLLKKLMPEEVLEELDRMKLAPPSGSFATYTRLPSLSPVVFDIQPIPAPELLSSIRQHLDVARRALRDSHNCSMEQDQQPSTTNTTNRP